mmetsp:Transcript_4808/g.17994  ORF Transcript_4808/g.17994 Transcript_4808/m.17994 type:complete len:212 (-) Transcript_4808:84-719(-)
MRGMRKILSITGSWCIEGRWMKLFTIRRRNIQRSMRPKQVLLLIARPREVENEREKSQNQLWKSQPHPHGPHLHRQVDEHQFLLWEAQESWARDVRGSTKTCPLATVSVDHPSNDLALPIPRCNKKNHPHCLRHDDVTASLDQVGVVENGTNTHEESIFCNQNFKICDSNWKRRDRIAPRDANCFARCTTCMRRYQKRMSVWKIELNSLRI